MIYFDISGMIDIAQYTLLLKQLPSLLNLSLIAIIENPISILFTLVQSHILSSKSFHHLPNHFKFSLSSLFTFFFFKSALKYFVSVKEPFFSFKQASIFQRQVINSLIMSKICGDYCNSTHAKDTYWHTHHSQCQYG